MDVDSQSRYERAKPKFKAKMNGLKLSKRIDKSQVEAMISLGSFMIGYLVGCA